MKTKLGISFAIVAVAAFLLGWSFGPQLASGPTANANVGVDNYQLLQDQPSKARTVSVMFDYGDGTVKTYEHLAFTEGQTLFDATKTAIEGDGLPFRYQPPGQYGILIDQIGSMAGGTDGKYWLWYENNRMGQVASDAYVLQPGDVIEWKFVNLKM